MTEYSGAITSHHCQSCHPRQLWPDLKNWKTVTHGRDRKSSILIPPSQYTSSYLTPGWKNSIVALPLSGQV